MDSHSGHSASDFDSKRNFDALKKEIETAQSQLDQALNDQHAAAGDADAAKQALLLAESALAAATSASNDADAELISLTEQLTAATAELEKALGVKNEAVSAFEDARDNRDAAQADANDADALRESAQKALDIAIKAHSDAEQAVEDNASGWQTAQKKAAALGLKQAAMEASDAVNAATEDRDAAQADVEKAESVLAEKIVAFEAAEVSKTEAVGAFNDADDFVDSLGEEVDEATVAQVDAQTAEDAAALDVKSAQSKSDDADQHLTDVAAAVSSLTQEKDQAVDAFSNAVDAAHQDLQKLSHSDRQDNAVRFDADQFKDPSVWDFGTDISGTKIDASAELKQDFPFSAADLSMLLDKSLARDVRIIEPNDGTPFERITDVNNYPGLGNTSQGTVENAIAQDDQSNVPEKVDGYMQILGPSGQALPNERQVTNTLSDQGDSLTPEEGGFNNLFMGVGQYIDHGIDLIAKGSDSMTVFLPDDDKLLVRDRFGNPVFDRLQLLNRAQTKEGFSDPLNGEFQNSKTPWFDQDQSYGATPALEGYLRARDDSGEFTAKLVDSSETQNVDLKFFREEKAGPVGIADFYSVLVNSFSEVGYSTKQEVRDVIKGVFTTAEGDENLNIYNNDKVLRVWDQKLRDNEFGRGITGNPRTDYVTIDGEAHSVFEASQKLKSVRATLFGNLREGSSNDTDFEALFNMLNGDQSHIAKFSPYEVLVHKASGDARTNENLQLIAISEVFQSNHNHLVDRIEASLEEIADRYPSMEDVPAGLEEVVALAKKMRMQSADDDNLSVDHEQAIFDMARTVNNAAYQRMIFDQYIVHLAGGVPFGFSESRAKELRPDEDKILRQPLTDNEHGYNGFHGEVDPAISLEFAVAGFRVGHSQIDPDLQGVFAERADDIIQIKEVIDESLIKAFVNPKMYNHLGGAAGVIAANSQDRAQSIDTYFVTEVKDMLLGRPLDLGAFNLARGPEMGIPTLNEFRQSITELFEETGVGNLLREKASDVSVGLADSESSRNAYDEFLHRMKPYETWGEFKENLRDSSQIDDFMALYGGPEADLDNNYGLNDVHLYIGGLAEKQVKTPTGEGRHESLMGSTFTFILQDTFDRSQDSDPEYYKISIPGSDILHQLAHQTWTPMIQTALEAGDAAQAIHQDTFRVARLTALEEGVDNFNADEQVDWDGRGFNQIIYGNSDDNVIQGSDGSGSASSDSSEWERSSDDIRAGDGHDSVDGGHGEDWIYGQGGNDTLRGGSDEELDHLFGGDGDDTIYGNYGDASFGENGDDVLIRLDGSGGDDGGLGHDVVLAGDSSDSVKGDSGAWNDANPEGNDSLFGGSGADEVIGRGGHDLVVGDGSGSSSKWGDMLYGDAADPIHNAELLARAIWDETHTKIVDTIVPITSGEAYSVLLGGVNPLSGERFKQHEIDAFRTYVEELRVVDDSNGIPDAGHRGPRPTLVVMPYAGPSGDDTIYTGHYEGIDSALEGRVDADELKAWKERNGYVQVSEGEDVAAEGEAAESDVSPTDLVFAGGGDDTIHTDGSHDTYVFGGEDKDTVYTHSSSDSSSTHLEIRSLNQGGADVEVTRSGDGATDHLFGVERIVTDSSTNSLSAEQADEALTVKLQTEKPGYHAAITSDAAASKELEVSNVNHFDLARKQGFHRNNATLELKGKIDYDGIPDRDKSDDNYDITWNGERLTVRDSADRETTYEGVQNVAFNYPTADHRAASAYYKEFADPALELGVELVRDTVHSSDGEDEVIIRAHGTEEEQQGQYFLALTAKSLIESSVDTLDVSLQFEDGFFDAFCFHGDDISQAIRFNDEILPAGAPQSVHVEVEGNTLRFAGAGLSALGKGEGIGNEKTLLATIAIDPSKMIKADFDQQLKVTADANVDSTVFSNLLSLRDMGDKFALVNNDLSVNVRAAKAGLEIEGGFDLGTERKITKPGEGSYTNLIRAGSTIYQTSSLKNTGEFTLTDVALEGVDQVDAAGNKIAAVSAEFVGDSEGLSQLGWESSDTATVKTTIMVDGDAAGQVLNTGDGGAGYQVNANGGYQWDTRDISEFQSKNVITMQGDLNFDGRVSMKDLAFLNAGAKVYNESGKTHAPSDVDANFDGEITMDDLSVISDDWNHTLHTDGELGKTSWKEQVSMDDLFEQHSNSWDSSAFAEQMAIETGMLAPQESDFVADLPTSDGMIVMSESLDAATVDKWNDQYQSSEV